MTQGTYDRLGVTRWDTSRTVIRRALGKLKKSAKARKYRSARHAFLRDMLARHTAWQELCRQWRM